MESNGMMIVGRDLEGSGHGLIETPSRHLPGETEKYQEKLQSE
jgi:hypothetical protein